jgi:predicted GNAT superfamily acetyltransferase
MAAALHVADTAPPDRAWLLTLNNACVPAVSPLTKAGLEALLAEAALARIISDATGPLGALIAFTRGAAYESANYRWFCAQAEPFLYIDRIMTLEASRSRGLGAALYADAAAWARAHGLPRLTCEVNEIPPNPRSLAFHERLGFRRVGALDHPGGKRVAMLEMRL